MIYILFILLLPVLITIVLVARDLHDITKTCANKYEQID
jgi:uncharacterized membrane protein YhaH (DUF805 family)